MKARPVGEKWSLFFILANERMRMKNGSVLILIFFGPLANGLSKLNKLSVIGIENDMQMPAFPNDANARSRTFLLTAWAR